MIDVEHVTYRYAGATEDNLKDFSLHIKKGECVVLTGESGCGKTCVTRLVNALIPHFYEGILQGNVRIGDRNTRDLQPHMLSDKIGSVFQNPRSQFFSLDTDSEIVFGMENKGVCRKQMRQRYQKIIQDLHIEALQGRNLFALSGGQKQTIAFASVYALDPDIYVLDEPSSNLDLEAIGELRRLLLFLKEQEKTILISEHRLYYLNGIADRIVLMEHGRLKKTWDAGAFAQIPQKEYEILGVRSFYPPRLDLPQTDEKQKGTATIEARDLAVGYARKAVASNLNFKAYPGEIVGIVGKNGCGKTTLAHTLCGLQKELDGTLLYEGKVLPWKKRIKKAYLVMQDPDYQLFTESVFQELKLAVSAGMQRQENEIWKMLTELNLAEEHAKHPMALSGGQKQRTAIGVAALMENNLLIFDEPTSGLDFKNMNRVAELLKMLSKKGKTILVISHDYELLMKTCSRVIRIE